MNTDREPGPTDETLPDVTPATGGALPSKSVVPKEVTEALPSARFGKFVRTEKLGAGGMGEVWKAWDTELNRWVALKFLKGGDEEEIARFKREAQTAGALSHPNIAAIHEVGQAHERHYIAMQYVAGQTLKSFPRKDVRTLAGLVKDAAEALQYAHEQGVIHRDIKPENLMVVSRVKPGTGRSGKGDTSHHLYVMDFGLARTVEGEKSVSGSVVGTPVYMAPEQGRGEAANPKADIYSLGATLYELVTDRKPFGGSNVWEILAKVQEEEPKAPRKVKPGIDVDLETIVVKCLEKEKARRYGSAGALAADLGRWLAGEAVEARRAGWGYRAKKWISRRRALMGVGALGVVGVAIALGVLGPAWYRAESQRAAMQELNRLWVGIATAREWTRQGFRKPQEICREFEKSESAVSEFIRANRGVPQALYVRARLRMCVSDLAGAEADLDDLLKREPTFKAAWTLKGMVQLERHHTLQKERDEGETRFRDRKQALMKRANEFAKRGAGPGAGIERWGLSRTREEEVVEVLAAALVRVSDPEGGEEALKQIWRAHDAAPSEEYCRHACVFQGDISEIRKRMNEAVKIAPNYAPARLDRGTWKLQTGDVEGGLKDASVAIELNPRLMLAYALRGACHAKLGHMKEGFQDYDKVVELSPAWADAILARAAAREALGEMEGALADIERALALDPGSAKGYYLRGKLIEPRGNAAGSEADMDKALALDPTYDEAWSFRGYLRNARGDFEGAEKDFTRAIELDPEDLEALRNRGAVRVERGNKSGAMSDFAEAIRLGSTEPSIRLKLAALQGESGQAAQGLKTLEEASVACPKSALVWLRLGEARAQAGQKRQAIDDLTRAAGLDAQLEKAWTTRSWLKRTLGDLDGAIADGTKAIDVNPGSGNGYFHRGSARQMKGETDAAIEDLTEALKCNPSSADAYNARGLAWKDKDVKMALLDFDRAVQHNPSFPEAYCNRGIARAMMGDLDRAEADFRKCLEVAPPDWHNRNSVQQWLDSQKKP